MNVRRHRLLASGLGALVGIAALAACAADEKPPPDDPCQNLTGAERTQCERPKQPPAPPQQEVKQDEPPPDTKSEGNDQSDTADPPQNQ